MNIDKSKFNYTMKRSSKMAIVFLKGNRSLKTITFEDNNLVLSVEEAIKLIKLPENKDKQWSVNGFPKVMTEYAFLKS